MTPAAAKKREREMSLMAGEVRFTPARLRGAHVLIL
jgi:hypothetical protein